MFSFSILAIHGAVALIQLNSPRLQHTVISQQHGRVAHLIMQDEEQPQRPRTSVYQTLTEQQIQNIHESADTLFMVLDRNGDDSVSRAEASALCARVLRPRLAEQTCWCLLTVRARVYS
uniref:EF-hand domain-containing protein n=1 Tax=Haptolina brevifila TaxID=156173 RepID=A0A7S2IW99_9EUKA|mmetsp:Transcript_71895/g.142523  ORF Transcript_71895/g.142523 Transcript_71895/m.142523 type:complete len:119 (+) Transcript_71895:121-477(+)